MTNDFPSAPSQPTPRSHADPDPGADPLVAALIELEQHVGSSGWDQPARLFALVGTRALLAAEPQLADQLGLVETAPGALTAIEQEFHTGEDLVEILAQIGWPETVDGCALALERNFLPAAYEGELPPDPGQAEEFVAQHPQRQELRVVAGALRTGMGHGVARLRSQPDELLGGPDLAPGIVAALAATLAPEAQSGLTVRGPQEGPPSE